MGCDIHAYIEVRDPAGAYAVTPEGERADEALVRRHVQNLEVDFHRDYTLFSLMADVRTDQRMMGVEPVKSASYERPHSEILRDKAEWMDAHSHSSMTVDELEEVRRRYDEVIRRETEAEPDGHPVVHQRMLDTVIDRLRSLGPYAILVFWFDN